MCKEIILISFKGFHLKHHWYFAQNRAFAATENCYYVKVISHEQGQAKLLWFYIEHNKSFKQQFNIAVLKMDTSRQIKTKANIMKSAWSEWHFVSE